MRRLTYVLVCALAFEPTAPQSEAVALAQIDRPFEDPVLAAIAAAAELPALANAALPQGYREIRIRTEQSMVCCASRPMLRLVEGPGEIRGTLWLFRTLVLRPGNPMPRDDERCAPLGEQHICVRPWNLSAGDWTAVGARLEQLGAWTLSDPCNPPRIVRNDDGSTSVGRGFPGDAGLLSVQRRIGSTVSAFDCPGPGLQREPEGLQANDIYHYLTGLSGVISPEPIRIAK